MDFKNFKNFKEVFDDGFKDAVAKIIGLTSPAHIFHNSYLLGQVQALADLEPEVIELRAKVAELEAKLEKYQNLEPVCYHYTVDCCGVDEDMFGHPEGYYPSDATPLYALEK